MILNLAYDLANNPCIAPIQRHPMNDFDNLDGWVTQLSNRSIISLRGPDSSSFLQGLTTQDMNLFQKEKERASIFTSFMNVKGKTLFDCFVCKPLLAH